VQDLIHPSLCEPPTNSYVEYVNTPSLTTLPDPYIAGVTQVNSGAKEPSLTSGKFKTAMGANHQLLHFESVYSWIPSVFRVSENGLDVRIESYINGLGPREQYPVLYKLIEKAFVLALPQLERTLAHSFEYDPTPSGE
jgi:hypothetical protein